MTSYVSPLARPAFERALKRSEANSAYLASLGPGYFDPEPGDTQGCQDFHGDLRCQLTADHTGRHEYVDYDTVRWDDNGNVEVHPSPTFDDGPVPF